LNPIAKEWDHRRNSQQQNAIAQDMAQTNGITLEFICKKRESARETTEFLGIKDRYLSVKEISMNGETVIGRGLRRSLLSQDDD
jgi:hypothetical protein